jgi:hypothetical protein
MLQKYLKYKQKYLKYKQKYLFLLEKINEPLHKIIVTEPKVGPDFNVDFNNDVDKGIMKLEFSHDLKKDKIINKTFYDLVNNNEIKINDNLVNNPEDYLQYLLLNNKTELFSNYKIDTSTTEISDLSNYNAIFDNLLLTNNLATKLYNLFKIKSYSETFIQNCEQFINKYNKRLQNIEEPTQNIAKASKTRKIISNEFKTEKGELKPEYLLEAILIGFLPISQNKLIKFSVFNKNTEFTKEIEIELKLLLQFCQEINKIINKLSKEDQIIIDYLKDPIIKDYLKDIDIVNQNINNLFELNINNLSNIIKDNMISKNLISDNKFTVSNDKIQQELYLLYIKDIERVVFSMKEARDSYYIKEITNMELKRKKIINSSKNKYDSNIKKENIFVTTDKILTFRCIINKIPVINILNNIIRYIVIFDDSQPHARKLRLIGNPFEIFDNNIENKIKPKVSSDIVTTIIKNPILKLSVLNKYLILGGAEKQNESDLPSLQSNSGVRLPPNIDQLDNKPGGRRSVDLVNGVWNEVETLQINNVSFYYKISNGIIKDCIKNYMIIDYKISQNCENNLKLLIIESFDCKTPEKVIEKIKWIGENLINDREPPNESKLAEYEEDFKRAKKKILERLDFVGKQMKSYDNYLEKGQCLKESTCQFIFILMMYNSRNFFWFEPYLLIMLMEYVFPNIDFEFNYKEIFFVDTYCDITIYKANNVFDPENRFKEDTQRNEDYKDFNYVIKLIKSQDPLYEVYDPYFSDDMPLDQF